jgi:hypothetical protein
MAMEPPPLGTGGDEWIQARVTGLGLAGRRDESRQQLAEMRQAPRVSAYQAWGDYLAAWLDRRPTDMLGCLSALSSLKVHSDPEFFFRVGWLLCDVGEYENGLLYLRQALTKAYFVPRPFRPVGHSVRCEQIHASGRFSRNRRWAGSKRWPLSVKPEESDSSADDAPASGR